MVRVFPIGRDAATGAFHQAMAPLVLSSGSDAFESVLFASARAATGCEHLTAYTYSPTHAPRLVIAANPGGAPIARETGETYVARYWDRDPGNRLCQNGDAGATGLLIRATGDDIRAAPFRQDCYKAAAWRQTGNRMIDRVSIVKRQGDRDVKISFHRAEWAGPFSDIEIRNIAEVADLLTALVATHDGTARHSAAAMDAGCCAGYIDAVRAACPDLTDREAEICARIVLGVSSEGMALDLGISINTVRTYRKRAYSRLNISSQNELMKIVLRREALH